MKKYFFTLILIAVLITACSKKEKEGEYTLEEKENMTQEFVEWADQFESDLAKLYTASAEAYFNASINNTEENWNNYSATEKAMNVKLSYKDDFEALKRFKQLNVINDAISLRRMTRLYNLMNEYQVNIKLLDTLSTMASIVEKKYGNFRAIVNGEKVSDNDIEDILQTETNSATLQEAWEAHKQIGPVVAVDVIKLVKLRNRIAEAQGYSNYHTMSLNLSEQNPEELEALFDDLDMLTRDAFISVKKDIDSVLSIKYNIAAEELMPWHYQNRFFQEAPKVFEIDIDKFYEDKDVVEITKKYYASIGMPIDGMLENSDLFEKPETGKNQHAYCTDIDRDKKDIRVLCNVHNNTSWMETMLHEFGHALYQYYVGQDLPWILKEPAHTFTTEAVAMFFGRLATNPDWMQAMLELTDEETESIREVCYKQELYRQLVFSRWVQVVYRFEKEMYANPDQDLNALWWQLVEKYQMLKKPADRDQPDWATKIHIASYPCYYHNYQLGELLASQFYYSLAGKLKAEDIKKESFTAEQGIDKFFIDGVFKPGAFFEWNDMIEKSTGFKLSPESFARQYVNK